MPKKIVTKKEIPISEVKEILKNVEELNQFQARAFEYVKKFSKIDPSKAQELTDQLIEKFKIERKDAVQVVNCVPTSVQELRTFFSTGSKRIILTSQLEEMLKILNQYRE
jgi:DNA-directed RNA polymerase subunit F